MRILLAFTIMVSLWLVKILALLLKWIGSDKKKRNKK